MTGAESRTLIEESSVVLFIEPTCATNGRKREDKSFAYKKDFAGGTHWGTLFPMSLEVEIKCRVTRDMKEHLQELARREGSGVKVSALIRRAIEREYFPQIYPVSEITALRAAESTKPQAL
jgi:hypothetical protein